MRVRHINGWEVSRRHAFHVLGLDGGGLLRRVRVGVHRVAIERGGIAFHLHPVRGTLVG